MDTSKIYIASSGSKAVAGSAFLTAIHYKDPIPEGVLIQESNHRNTVDRDELIKELRKINYVSHTVELSVEEIKAVGVKAAAQRRIDSLVARVCVASGIYSLPLVLTSNPEHGTSYQYTIKTHPRCPELVGANAIAYYNFRQHIVRYHELHPHYDWINNSGRITDNHRLGLLRRGPSPLHRHHRCVLELGRWLLMRVRQKDKRVRPFADYLLSEPPWWYKHFSQPFLQEDRTVIKKLLTDYHQDPSYAADLYSERVRKWSIENAPL